MTAVYYITAHGYGHGARSCDILNALRAAAPDVRIMVKSGLPPAFLASRLADGIELRAEAFDTGLVQKDSIRVDLDASLAAVEALCAREEELVAREAAFLRKEGAGVVVADIPAIPLAAAQRAGVPDIATGNFGWDWIYSDFAGHDPRWATFAARFRAIYEKTSLLLRQPFAEPMETFSRRIDLPLLAKPGTPCRDRIARAAGADPAKPWVLLAFTALDLDAAALGELARLADYALFAVEPLAWPGSAVAGLPRAIAPFSDILASMDAVVAKPGFGIVSECIANGKPIAYTDRENFREYPLLVEGIKRYCRNVFLPNDDLYGGRIGPALGRMASAPAPRERIADGGAEIAARHILGRMLPPSPQGSKEGIASRPRSPTMRRIGSP